MHSHLFRACLLALSLALVSCGADNIQEILPVRVQTDLTQGRELFQGLAACGFCHGQKIEPGSLPTGGRKVYDVYGEVIASNLTPAQSGLKDWEAKQIVSVIRRGIGKDERVLSPEVHRGYEWMSDKDLLSIVAYMDSLPSSEKKHERRELSFVDRNTTGILDEAKTVTGFVPAVEPRHTLAYGRYLADHVARCSVCHSSPSGYFSTEQYLAGGKPIKFGEGEKLAPSLRGTGLPAWSNKDVLNYLKNGLTPDNKRSDPRFCPIEFFARAPDADLNAIAAYLKSVTQ